MSKTKHESKDDQCRAIVLATYRWRKSWTHGGRSLKEKRGSGSDEETYAFTKQSSKIIWEIYVLTVGLRVGLTVGDSVGGDVVGLDEGIAVGLTLGYLDGNVEGLVEGTPVGENVGN